MGRRGPAPKPTALKLLHGDIDPRKVKGSEPIPRDALPVLPDGASDAVREVWDYTMRELAAMKIITAADRDALLAYCEAVVNHRQATVEVRERGLVLTGLHGGPVRNPALAVQRDAAQMIRQFAQEYGLTPSARSRIRMEGRGASVEDADNPFAAASSD